MILPYAYGTIIHTIRVWLYHMRIRVWYVPYAYGIKYAYGIEHRDRHYIYTRDETLRVASICRPRKC